MNYRQLILTLAFACPPTIANAANASTSLTPKIVSALLEERVWADMIQTIYPSQNGYLSRPKFDVKAVACSAAGGPKGDLFNCAYSQQCDPSNDFADGREDGWCITVEEFRRGSDGIWSLTGADPIPK